MKSTKNILRFLLFFCISAMTFSMHAAASTATAPDLQAPTVPAGLSAENVTYRSIALCWTASKDNKGVKGYQLFRDGKKIVTVAKTSYTSKDLAPGRKYTYIVKAYDAAGNLSGGSAPLSVSTLQDLQPPSAPAGLQATGADFTSITLSWGASTDNTDLKGYEIFCNNKKTASTTASTYVCKRLSPGLSYSFSVRAVDIAGNPSAHSNPITCTTSRDTLAPSIPSSVKVQSVTETQISLTWAPSSDNVKIKGYAVFRDGVKAGTTSKTSYSIKGLIPGQTYSFTVKAIDSTENVSAESVPLQAATLRDLQLPQAPGDLKVKSVQGSSVSLIWTGSTDNVKIQGYRIYCNGIEIASTTKKSYTVKCPKGIGLYIFSVKSVDIANNYSKSSNSVSVILV